MTEDPYAADKAIFDAAFTEQLMHVEDKKRRQMEQAERELSELYRERPMSVSERFSLTKDMLECVPTILQDAQTKLSNRGKEKLTYQVYKQHCRGVLIPYHLGIASSLLTVGENWSHLNKQFSDKVKKNSMRMFTERLDDAVRHGHIPKKDIGNIWMNIEESPHILRVMRNKLAHEPHRVRPVDAYVYSHYVTPILTDVLGMEIDPFYKDSD